MARRPDRRGTRTAERSTVTSLRTALVVLVVALASAACRTSAADQSAARRATAEAEEKASETTLTSAAIEPREEALADVDGALREQQLDYRRRLQSALDALDAGRADAKKRGPAHAKVLDARREVLKRDLDALDRTTAQEWAALKARIDRDLREQTNNERQGR
jgi:hypothetical protein